MQSGCHHCHAPITIPTVPDADGTVLVTCARCGYRSRVGFQEAQPAAASSPKPPSPGEDLPNPRAKESPRTKAAERGSRPAASPVRFEATPAPPRPNTRLHFVLLGGLFLAFFVAAWLRFGTAAEPTANRSRTISPSAGVTTDASGEVVRVVGENPDRVLVALCEDALGKSYEPFGVMPSGPAPVRVGIIRDKRRPDQLLAVAIREDSLTGRWFSGDGVRPIVPSAAPSGAATSVLPIARGGR